MSKTTFRAASKSKMEFDWSFLIFSLDQKRNAKRNVNFKPYKAISREQTFRCNNVADWNVQQI